MGIKKRDQLGGQKHRMVAWIRWQQWRPNEVNVFEIYSGGLALGFPA